MAIAIDKDVEVREAIAKVSAFFQKWEKRTNLVSEFMTEAKSLRHEVVTLLNVRDNLDRLNKEAQIDLEAARREASTRLSSVEQGHRALVDELTRKKLEVDNKAVELEKRDALLAEANHRAELAKAAYEQKLAEITAVSKKK